MTDPLVHPAHTLTTPTGDTVSIDAGMVPLIRELWRLGYATTACCQDVGEATAGVRRQREKPLGYGGDGFINYHRGWALLKMPTADARRLLALLADTPPFTSRVRERWRPGSWRMHVPLEPGGLAAEALLHFPAQQIPQLTALLRAIPAQPTREKLRNPSE